MALTCKLCPKENPFSVKEPSATQMVLHLRNVHAIAAESSDSASEYYMHLNVNYSRGTIRSRPYDPYCERYAEDMEDIDNWREEDETRSEYIMNNDGTYDPATGFFACDRCYIMLGQPSSPQGWKAGTPNRHLRFRNLSV